MSQRVAELTVTIPVLRLLSILFLMTFSASPCLSQQPPGSDSIVLAKAVAQLGINPIASDSEYYNVLVSNPRMSIGILIDSLQVLANPEKDSVQLRHVCAIIRILRFITGGLEFCSESHYHFGDSLWEPYREEWLERRHGTCVTFFAYWTSREHFFIAPIDAQQNIIAQWRKWYSRLSEDYLLKPWPNQGEIWDWAW